MKEQKTILEKLFDLLGNSSALIFFLSLLLKVWVEDEYQWILNRICLSALIVFFASLILYGLICYESDKDN